MDAKSQNALVLTHLKKVGPITPLEALRLHGIMRLGARVHELRESGHNIVTEMIKVQGRKGSKPARVARYSLARAKAAA
ncbi:hypothetical protein G167_gp65 [Burkholderia phage BcepMigl]|uniref:Winged helix-turn-helix domain-containing protein n=1 Tax=Burkholderia phage BcepMigl TaxID=2886899 RepID=I6XKU0_9CAUD|nr:hypothetical protein G167_gp65 [Burkholderia phage BcepMigl]AFN39089.1 hypothetical protein BcepMigl_gp20 [Burkholderia phage BcepMigl]